MDSRRRAQDVRGVTKNTVDQYDTTNDFDNSHIMINQLQDTSHQVSFDQLWQ